MMLDDKVPEKQSTGLRASKRLAPPTGLTCARWLLRYRIVYNGQVGPVLQGLAQSVGTFLCWMPVNAMPSSTSV